MASDDWFAKFFSLFGEPDNREGQFFQVLDMLKQQQVPHQPYNFGTKRSAGGDGPVVDDDRRFCTLHEQHKHYQAKASAQAATVPVVNEEVLLSGINEIMHAKRQRHERKRNQSAVQMKITNLKLQQSIEENDGKAANMLKMKMHKEEALLAAAEMELNQQLAGNEQLMENYKKIFNEVY